MDLIHQSATRLLERLAAREVSSVELTTAFLDQIARHDTQVRAFLHVDREPALAQAAEIDRRRQQGGALGPLAGLPVAIKDNLCGAGQPTTCASRMLAGFVPPYEATVVARLRQADAVLLGRTNLDEFAMGGSTENSAFRVTANPWDQARIAGGSSGGSAAALAASMAAITVGSDTGGSIRQPAALCGVTGLKPSYGRVSRYGLVAFASSLDQVGPLGRSVADTALLLEVLSGHDPRDSTSVDRPVPRYTATLDEPLAGVRLGLVKEHFAAGLDREVESAVREAVRVYESLGATVREISLPHARYAVATYYVVACSEASSNLARYDGVHYGHRSSLSAEIAETSDSATAADGDNPLVQMYRRSRAEGFGAEVKRRIMLGTYALSAGYYDAYYLKALRVRRRIREDYDRAFGEVDLIIGPVTSTAAFPIGEKTSDPLAMYLVDVYTVGANLAGICGISLPCGLTSENLPIGLQLQAPPFAEETLLRGAMMFERETDWHQRRPALS